MGPKTTGVASVTAALARSNWHWRRTIRELLHFTTEIADEVSVGASKALARTVFQCQASFPTEGYRHENVKWSECLCRAARRKIGEIFAPSRP
jgi:hypothetical protein